MCAARHSLALFSDLLHLGYQITPAGNPGEVWGNIPHFSDEETCSERLSNLLKVTKLISG